MKTKRHVSTTKNGYKMLVSRNKSYKNCTFANKSREMEFHELVEVSIGMQILKKRIFRIKQNA